MASLFLAVGFGAEAAELEARSPDCPPPARYVMPEGVELSARGDRGVAPADLPGSRAGFAVPPEIKFDLNINPVGPSFDQSRLPLGEVSIDRKTGTASIDGQPLGAADPCANRDPSGSR